MVKQKKVIICVSTYNGEKYIETQLDSLLNQTYPNIEIFVRDDGSSDNTIEILKEYAKAGKIHLICGKNSGVVASFYKVLQKSFQFGDYFAFCDQDDKWHDDKIERAVAKIEEQKNHEKPILYFSAFNYCDKNLKFAKKSCINIKSLNFINSLVECIPPGMSMLFNRELAKRFLQSKPDDICGHDWWVYMIAAGSGIIVYDNVPTIEYRRLEQSVSPTGKRGFSLQIYRIKKFVFGKYFVNIRKQIDKFRSAFGDELDDNNTKILNLFSLGYNPIKALKKTFYPNRFRQNIPDEILCRILFLFGRL